MCCVFCYTTVVFEQASNSKEGLYIYFPLTYFTNVNIMESMNCKFKKIYITSLSY